LAAIVGQILFVAGWLLAGAIEGDGYSAARHDISDLAALTAHHPWLPLATEGIAGAATLAFVIWALRPSLTAPGLRVPVSAWLVALSLPVLDDLGDVFFRLDCRAADAGCSTSQAAASWHGKAHLIVFAVAALATVVAPFALSHRMQRLDRWRALSRPTRRFGVLIIAALLVVGASSGTAVQGTMQRLAATFVSLAIVPLALHVFWLSAGQHEPSAPAPSVVPSSPAAS
jgi:hypothetical protein